MSMSVSMRGYAGKEEEKEEGGGEEEDKDANVTCAESAFRPRR